jgi:hypothetical protein
MAGPGGWNDPDMMMFGNAGARLTPDQAASHLALWAILKAPMLISADVTALTASELGMLTNTRLLGISQDPLGIQARRVFPDASFRVGGSVVGARSVPSYSLPLAMNWVLAPLTTAEGNTSMLRNLGAGLCLGRAGGGSVQLMECDASVAATQVRCVVCVRVCHSGRRGSFPARYFARCVCIFVIPPYWLLTPSPPPPPHTHTAHTR